MKFLYFAHIPFEILFVVFTMLLVAANWRGVRRP